MPKKDTSLGKSLIRAHKKRINFVAKDGYRHTSDLQDGRDFGRLNLNSVTERTSLDDFLDKTALAENEYNAEFNDIKIVEPDSSHGLLSENEKLLVASAQEKNREILCIPRRPLWDSSTTKEELDAREREAFLSWRRKLALLQEEQHINLTPYEKNLEIWRQLWRVIERSDVIIQIVDARNPLLFRCTDLEAYVKEVDEQKLNILLVNKADFLMESERKNWCDYFDKVGVQVAFFSALQQMQRDPEDEDFESTETVKVDEEVLNSEGEDSEYIENSNKFDGAALSSQNEDSESTENSNKVLETVLNTKDTDFESAENNKDDEIILNSHVKNDPKVLSREALISFLKTICRHANNDDHVPSVGLVGYPNVGKSSTINAILMSKRVSVSATPGKTKHFQTFIVDKDLCLCDCPGLVFPNFVSTKAEMVINGILPIDQLTNWDQPVSLITNFIPQTILESTYSILIPRLSEEKSSKSPPTAEEFLNAYGYNRGFMTHRGLPDNARSARYVLKDFVNGKLLYCHAPPGMKQEEYHLFPDVKGKKSTIKVSGDNEALVEQKKVLSEADKKFFTKTLIHMKGKAGNKLVEAGNVEKPWKKHHNRNKKEKLRRIYTNPYD